MIEWQVRTAKDNLSKIITLALAQEPQRVRRRNQTVVVISEKEYQKLTHQGLSFVDYLTKGPSFEALDIARDTDEGREIDL